MAFDIDRAIEEAQEGRPADSERILKGDWASQNGRYDADNSENLRFVPTTQEEMRANPFLAKRGATYDATPDNKEIILRKRRTGVDGTETGENEWKRKDLGAGQYDLFGRNTDSHYRFNTPEEAYQAYRGAMTDYYDAGGYNNGQYRFDENASIEEMNRLIEEIEKETGLLNNKKRYHRYG